MNEKQVRILWWRLLSAIACSLTAPTVVLCQAPTSTPEVSSEAPFRSRTSLPVAIQDLRTELQRLQQQAPPLIAPKGRPFDWIDSVVQRITDASDPLQEFARCKQDKTLGPRIERLMLPAKQLTYRESHDAATLYGTLFGTVRDGAKVELGNKAVQYLKQYIKLAHVREQVWEVCKSTGIPAGGNRTLSSFCAGEQGEALDPFEYHNGFYCVHLWYFGGHQYTSFMVTPDGNLEYVTLELAAQIVEDSQSRPGTTDAAVQFLREVLRAFPYKSDVIRSAQDIPPPRFDRFSKEDAEREKAKWQAFLQRIGPSIRPPTDEIVHGSKTYVVFVYQKLGGQVIRYSLNCSVDPQLQVQEETIARWVGDYWAIM